MKIKLLIILSLLLTSTMQANYKLGSIDYKINIKKECKMSSWELARNHTQDEWEELFQKKDLLLTIQTICKSKNIKIKNEEDLFDFLYEYASDSGNVPSCGN